MVVVTSVGFHGTGSGAVDDFFREFTCFAQSGYEKECRFLQDPDGVSDLEYNLVENPHRLNSGYALKRFLIMMKRYKRVYKNIFGPDYMIFFENYVDDLINIKYKGFWFGDIWLDNTIEKYLYWSKRVINKHTYRIMGIRLFHTFFPNVDTYHVDITEEEFLAKTQKLMNTLCTTLLTNDARYVFLDQLVHPNNLKRYMRYVENLLVIVVDRDPRDVYIEQRNDKGQTLPINPVEFSKVYKDSRKMKLEGLDEDKVLFIRFEDMIYKYNQTADKLMKFVGATEEEHVSPKSKFNPDISIKNTRLWEKYPQYAEEVGVIEREIPEFLYEYEENN